MGPGSFRPPHQYIVSSCFFLFSLAISPFAIPTNGMALSHLFLLFVLQCWTNVCKDVQLLMEGCLCLEEVRSALDQSWAHLCQCAETQETPLRHGKHGKHQGCKALNKRYKVLMGRYTMKDHEDILHILVAQILFCSFSVKRWAWWFQWSNAWHGISHGGGVSYRLAFFLSLCNGKEGHHKKCRSYIIGRYECAVLARVWLSVSPILFLSQSYTGTCMSLWASPLTCMYQQALYHYETMCSR